MFEVSAAVARSAINIAKKVAENFARKLFESYVEKRKIGKETAELWKKSMESYLRTAFEQHSYVSTIALQSKSKKLDDIYIPLKIEAGSSVFVIDKYPEALFAANKSIMICDRAGMGKSTIIKRIILKCLERAEVLPISIELRRLDPEVDLETAACGQIIKDTSNASQRLFEELLRDKEGKVQLFLDGYDEVSPDVRGLVADRILEFRQNYPRVSVVCTSRPEAALASFTGFVNFQIRGLRKEEAFALLRKYDDANGRHAAQIIEKLGRPEYSSVHEFLSNPLLTSLLYRCWEFKSKIPLRKHIFYRQIFDALYEGHDLSKQGAYERTKVTGLDPDDFHRVFRAIAFYMGNRGMVELECDRLAECIEKCKASFPHLSFKANEFIKDATTSVPLFVRDGVFIRWAHKSIQEYFMAKFILKDLRERRDEAVKKVCMGSRTSLPNVVEMLYDMDESLVNAVAVREFIEDYLEHCNKIGCNKLELTLVELMKCAAYFFDIVMFRMNQTTSHGPSTGVFYSRLSEGENEERPISMYVDGSARVMIVLYPSRWGPLHQALSDKHNRLKCSFEGMINEVPPGHDLFSTLADAGDSIELETILDSEHSWRHWAVYSVIAEKIFSTDLIAPPMNPVRCAELLAEIDVAEKNAIGSEIFDF